MDSERNTITAAGSVMVTAYYFFLQRQTAWVRPSIRARRTCGAYDALVNELALEDPKAYRVFVRMDQATFDCLLGLVTPIIRRKDTRFREAIPAGERLAVTLLFLATGKRR